MPMPFTQPSAGFAQPTYDTYGQKEGVDLVQPPGYFGSKYTGQGALTIPGVQTDPYGYSTGLGQIISGSNPFGGGDFSGLSPDQQTTAKSVQDAFKASMGAYGRGMERYSMPVSGPMLASIGKDAALAQANTTASLVNSNAQAGAARNAYLDAFNKSPTTMQNLAALTSLLSGGLNVANQSGLLGLIKNAISGSKTPTPDSSTSGKTPNTDSSGNTTGDIYDYQGNYTGTRDQYGNVVPGYPQASPGVSVTPPSDVITTPLAPPPDFGDFGDVLYG